jgi:hypothetical protein
VNKKTILFLSLVFSLALICGCGLPSSNPAKPADPGAIPDTGSFKIKMTFPSSALGKTYTVMLTKSLDFSQMDLTNTLVGPWSGEVNSKTLEFTTPVLQTYTGTYYVLAWVSNSDTPLAPDGTLQTSYAMVLPSYPLPGDFVGIYGGTIDNLPSKPNASVSGYGVQTFQIEMPLQEANIKGVVNLPHTVNTAGSRVFLISADTCYLSQVAASAVSGSNSIPFGFLAMPGFNYKISAEVKTSDGFYIGVYGSDIPGSFFLRANAPRCPNGAIVNVPASGLIINTQPANVD